MNLTRAWSTWGRYALSLGSVAIATLILTQIPGLHETTIALMYLLVVLITATTVGLVPAIMASLLAFLSFNYFFVPPLHTLMVADPQDILRLFTLLVVSIVTSSLAGRAREQATTAQRNAAELANLLSLSQTLSAEVTLERTLPVVAETTMRVLNVPACSVLLYDANGRLAERATAGAPPAVASCNVDTFLRMGPRVLGVLRVVQRSLREPLSRAEERRLEAIASQAVLVLERARLVDEAGQARAVAESERVKTTLFSSLSHDLRTPLAVIKGAVTNLLDESVAWDAAARRDLLNAVNEECDRLNRLVGNLLEMSRLEAGAPHPARGWHDLADLAANVVARMQPQLAGRAVAIDMPDSLPAVYMSYMQIDQVLTNLLENVAKYTPPGTPIRIQARMQSGQIEVEVRDWGPGIPQGMLARIFEKFVRAADPERHADGSGLGLAISKGIVELHGGRIWAENMADGGARFVFSLPAAESAAAMRMPQPLERESNL